MFCCELCCSTGIMLQYRHYVAGQALCCGTDIMLRYRHYVAVQACAELMLI